MVTVSCSPRLDVTVQAMPIQIAITMTPFMPVMEVTPTVSKQIEVIPTMESTPVPTSRNLEGVYDVSIESSYLTEWFYRQFKELQIVNCELPCTEEKIESLLDSHSVWVVAEPNEGRILYTYSGWDVITGPEFGEIFLRLYNSGNLNDTVLCLEEDICYLVVDSIILEKDYVGSEIHINELFEDTRDDDYFILTCSELIVPGFYTPKLIVQLKKI